MDDETARPLRVRSFARWATRTAITGWIVVITPSALGSSWERLTHSATVQIVLIVLSCLATAAVLLIDPEA